MGGFCRLIAHSSGNISRSFEHADGAAATDREQLGMMREALAKLDRHANERGILSTRSVDRVVFLHAFMRIFLPLSRFESREY
jgi:hypothetical protein